MSRLRDEVSLLWCEWLHEEELMDVFATAEAATDMAQRLVGLTGRNARSPYVAPQFRVQRVIVH